MLAPTATVSSSGFRRHKDWDGGFPVHHVKHKKHGGKTSTKDCVLLYFFHHQIVIHR
jgi:hypothetical protein